MTRGWLLRKVTGLRQLLSNQKKKGSIEKEAAGPPFRFMPLQLLQRSCQHFVQRFELTHQALRV